MRILYAGMMYDYGDPRRGLSFEHTNLYDTLDHMGHEIIYFDFMVEHQRLGKAGMSSRLVDIVRAEKPDLLFCILFTNQFDVDKIRHISEKTDTLTFNWFCDDHWRFDNYSRHWASAFNWVSTTAHSALAKYRALGYSNVIKTQWACNHFLYRPFNLPLKYDVTFIGQPHGNRRQIISALRKSGIDVQTWGYGWERGRVSQDEMIAIFNQSRININLSNTGVLEKRRPWRRWSRTGPRPVASQIKGRNFEVPGCGAFLLTDRADNLDDYYLTDKEVGVFDDSEDLAATIRHYLASESERSLIAEAGYRRTVSEHTYELRFNAIFDHLGLRSL